MKKHAMLIATVLLAGCAGMGAGDSSGTSGTTGSSGTSASGGEDRVFNTDVSDAVSRGSTQGFSPYSPPPGR